MTTKILKPCICGCSGSRLQSYKMEDGWHITCWDCGRGIEPQNTVMVWTMTAYVIKFRYSYMVGALSRFPKFLFRERPNRPDFNHFGRGNRN